MDTGDSVTTPQLKVMDTITEYCFIVTASSGNMTVAVKGSINGKLNFQARILLKPAIFLAYSCGCHED